MPWPAYKRPPAQVAVGSSSSSRLSCGGISNGHERCLAEAAGVDQFDVVTTVPVGLPPA